MNAGSNHESTQPVVPKTLLQRFAKQIGFGVLCSCIATAIVQFAHIKDAVLVACDAVGYVGGRPLSGEKGVLKKGEDKLKEIEKAAKDKIGHTPLPIPANLPTLHPTPEQMETKERLKREKEERERESQRKIVIAKLEAMGVPFDPEASLEKLLVELNEAEDMQRKRPLLDHADKIGLHVDPQEPYDVLKNRIKEAKDDADYQEQERIYEKNMAFRQQVIDRYNARCPNPKCHRAFKTTAKSGNFRCPKCKVAFTPAQARANWTMPPFPPQPKRKTGVMDRLKKVFKG